MLFLIALILAFGFAFLCHKPLKEHKNIFYIFAVVITIVLAVADFRNLPTFLNSYVIALFSRGALATALWCVVMWAGAFPNGSKPIKTIMPIRGELSILTAILTLGHNIGYGKTYFVRLFTNAQSMSTNQLVASILTIIMLLIMIPLTIMSFPVVRKKMNPKQWKKIQRLAYAFYALIYTHVMVLCIPLAKMGRSGYLLNVAMYSLVFIGYAIFRIKKYLAIKKKVQDSPKTNIVCILTTLVLSGIMVMCSSPKKVADTPTVGESSNIEVTTTTGSIYTTVTDITTTTESTQTDVTTSISDTDTTSVTETDISETSSTTTGEEDVTTEVTTQNTTVTTTATATEQNNNNSNNDNVAVNDNSNNQQQNNDSNNNNNNSYEEQPSVNIDNTPNEEQAEPQPDPEPVYVYNNGTYTATAYGYDGDVEITITIENDVITSINGYSLESDPWYFEQASASVYQQILANQNPNVDAVSGATYSSKAIMSAVQSALDSARR